MRALSHLHRGESSSAGLSTSAALEVLYELAAAPETAGDALAVLHELQVHQVELELQAEELQRANAELEAALRRQTELFEAVPVSCYTVNRDSVIQEVNLRGALLLQSERDALPGRPLCHFFAPKSAHMLLRRLAEVSRGGTPDACELDLLPHGAAPARCVRASVSADPASGARFLVALMPAGEATPWV